MSIDRLGRFFEDFDDSKKPEKRDGMYDSSFRKYEGKSGVYDLKKAEQFEREWREKYFPIFIKTIQKVNPGWAGLLQQIEKENQQWVNMRREDKDNGIVKEFTEEMERELTEFYDAREAYSDCT